MFTITTYLTLVIIGMGAYALIFDFHYANRTPGQRTVIRLLFIILSLLLILRILGIWV